MTQDAPVNGLGDGDTSPDAVLQGSSVLLRAERSGQGNGRVYAVHFTADDGLGGTLDRVQSLPRALDRARAGFDPGAGPARALCPSWCPRA
ncbi:MAG: hypothetical protein HYY20_09085 [Candidatus Tectomicrobia bacterium]|uniref:Uncharacterized protein n=1 Tax=Tectimicrobiota bacterium TaxID=2528274 RepID=A0A932CPP2_UNCTE|nr:hypothetical protein [Candidatus Tectomicrobia bacterium]